MASHEKQVRGGARGHQRSSKQEIQKWMPRAQGSTSTESTQFLDGAESNIEFQQEESEGNSLSARTTSVQAQSDGADNDIESQQEASEVNSPPGRSTSAQAQLRATFYPKFENEKSDQEVRTRMIEVVESGRGVLEVSLKHSGSLFMYSGDHSGAFAKNSYGNLYTAVGVFVLGRTFQEAWGAQASQKQREFNDYLETFHLCISMELVTAVLGDHGQRPKQDYVVVTAVTDLKGKPRFYATPDIIAFCLQWRLPTNHIWLFSSRKSATSFFTAFDALCEEGTASVVTRTLDEVADISLPASKSHGEVQGEILEGLVARIVSPESTEKLQTMLKRFHLVDCKVDSDQLHLGKSLREICAQYKANEEEQIYALLKSVGPQMCSDWSDWTYNGGSNTCLSKFLKAKPVDHVTTKLQEMLRVLQDRKFQVRYPCRLKSFDSKEQKTHYKMTVHVLNDFVFRNYQSEMRRNPDLWPLYRGFFIDVCLTHDKQKENSTTSLLDKLNDLHIDREQTNRLADESENLMLKLKFLPYKIRTFLIRNGLSTLFQSGFPAYRKYYLRQMRNWNTAPDKQRQLDGLLTEWAQYITGKCRGRGLDDRSYLSEAEPFLERFAKRSLVNKKLVGYSGIVAGMQDFTNDVADDGDVSEQEVHTIFEQRFEDLKGKGMIVFFPGIPGCGKSALCKELLHNPGGLADGRTMHTLMGDLVKGRYWPKLAQQRQQGPATAITLADKNAPNVEVWKTIEDMCRITSSIGVPVVPDSEGAELNPFSLEVLALFMYRVLQRVNHPGKLDKTSPNAGHVLLTFYELYAGKDRKEFEETLKGRFGYLVKLPVLKANRPAMPSSIQEVLTQGLNLFRRHSDRHGRLDSTKGQYQQEWSSWEKQLREVLNGNAAYFQDVQVPFEEAVQSLRQQLLAIARGEITLHTTVEEQQSFRSITFAAVSLSGEKITNTLQKLAESNKELEKYFRKRTVIVKDSAHVTLAHKNAHGVAAVAAFGEARGVLVHVQLTALLFSSKLCALEVHILENDKGISSRNEWPHVTVWTAHGTKAKEANFLPQLVLKGDASRVDFTPVVISGVVELL
eukprot:c21581_g1_i1 orf=128-3352(+)